MHIIDGFQGTRLVQLRTQAMHSQRPLCTRLVTLQRVKRSRLQKAIVVVPIGSPINAKTRQVNKLF